MVESQRMRQEENTAGKTRLQREQERRRETLDTKKGRETLNTAAEDDKEQTIESNI